MQKMILFLVMAMSASVLTSCVIVQGGIVPSENYETKQIAVDSFDGISTSTAINVVYTQTTEKQSVEVYAPDNLMDYVKVYVKDGILKVGFQSDEYKGICIKGKHRTEIRICAPAIHSLNASSSGDIVLKNGLNTDGKVTINASSSGEVEGDNLCCGKLVLGASSSGDIGLGTVKCDQLEVSASSSGDVEIKQLITKKVMVEASSAGDVVITEGACEYANFNASSSGEIVAKGLKADHIKASASSAGDISCYPLESLKAKSSSSGNIGYLGNPKSIDYSHKKGVHKLD